jgi:hypothetical protein
MNKSPNFASPSNPDIWTKRLPLYKNNNYCLTDAELEAELQIVASKYGFAPKVFDTRFDDQYYYIDMKNLKNECIANVYGDQPSDIDNNIWNKIRHIVKTLYEEEGIAYIDINPYNFIEINDKIFIIDFGHASYIGKTTLNDEKYWFLKHFLTDEINTYNPDFA